MNCRFISLKKLNVFTKDVCLYMYIEFESLFEVVVHCYIMYIIDIYYMCINCWIVLLFLAHIKKRVLVKFAKRHKRARQNLLRDFTSKKHWLINNWLFNYDIMRFINSFICILFIYLFIARRNANHLGHNFSRSTQNQNRSG